MINFESFAKHSFVDGDVLEIKAIEADARLTWQCYNFMHFHDLYVYSVIFQLLTSRYITRLDISLLILSLYLLYIILFNSRSA